MSQNGVISAFPPVLACPELLHCQGSGKLMAFYQQWHKSHLLGCARAEVTFLQTLSPAGLNKVFLQELRGCQGKMNCSSWRETCSTVIWLLHSNWDGGVWTDQEKMDCMHRDVHGPGQMGARPFCAGEEPCLLHASEVPQDLHMGEVIGLGHSPGRLSLENGWHKKT